MDLPWGRIDDLRAAEVYELRRTLDFSLPDGVYRLEIHYGDTDMPGWKASVYRRLGGAWNYMAAFTMKNEDDVVKAGLEFLDERYRCGLEKGELGVRGGTFA
jgi:hypothetical protein